ncbi:MAG: glycosyltransferase family 39 protein [Kiritimatiellia bacterium]
MRSTFTSHYTWAFALFVVISLCLHVKSFYTPHVEGDEVVYLTLAREMGWDLSHYTTQDDPVVSGFPSSVYSKPLFHHPPLFPYVLKTGFLTGTPVLNGLIFQNISFLILLWGMTRTARLFRMTPQETLFLLALTTFCPVLLYSSSKLHLDAACAAWLFTGTVLLLEASRRNSPGLCLGAGLLYAVAMNIKFTAVVIVPPLAAACFLLVAPATSALSPAETAARWKCLLAMFLPVVVLGLHHYVRFAIVYGTIDPSGINVVTSQENAAWNAFLQTVYSRTRLHMLAYLLLVYPLLTLCFFMSFWKAAFRYWKKRQPEGLIAAGAVYTGLLLFAKQFWVMRFFAFFLPFAFVSAVLVLKRASYPGRRIVLVLLWLTLFTALTTSFRNVIMFPRSDIIVPSVFDLFPTIARYYL